MCVLSQLSPAALDTILLVHLTLLEVTLQTQFLPHFGRSFFVDEVDWGVIQGAAQPQHVRPICPAKLAQHLVKTKLVYALK